MLPASQEEIMFFNLPLSNDKDLTINTDNEKPLQIKDWRTGKSTVLTKEEASALIELLLLNGSQILLDLNQDQEKQ